MATAPAGMPADDHLASFLAALHAGLLLELALVALGFLYLSLSPCVFSSEWSSPLLRWPSALIADGRSCTGSSPASAAPPFTADPFSPAQRWCTRGCSAQQGIVWFAGQDLIPAHLLPALGISLFLQFC
jgi:hypothetical protein